MKYWKKIKKDESSDYEQILKSVQAELEEKDEIEMADDGDDLNDAMEEIGGELAEGKGRIVINVEHTEDDSFYSMHLLVSKLDIENLQIDEKNLNSKDKDIKEKKDKEKDKEKEKKKEGKKKGQKI